MRTEMKANQHSRQLALASYPSVMPQVSTYAKGTNLKVGIDVHEAGMNQVEGSAVCPFLLNIINLELHIRRNP
jgi:hypothetical protein